MALHAMRRRKIVKTAPVVAGLSIAGCLGDSDEGNDDTAGDDTNGGSQDVEFQPEGGVVETISAASEGSSRYIIPSVWAEHKNQLWDEYDVTEQVTSLPGGGGIESANTFEREGEPDGGMVLSRLVVALMMGQISQDVADYDVSNWIPFQMSRLLGSSWAVSSDNTYVEDYFEVEWDEMMENFKSGEWRMGTSGGVSGAFQVQFVEQMDPNLEPGDITVVHFDGGSDARAAMERGEIEVYSGSVIGTYHRDEWYHSQFVFLNPDVHEMHVDKMESVIEEDITYITDTPFPEAEAMADILTNGLVHFLPGDTPDEIVELHEEVARETAGPELEQAVNDAAGEGEYSDMIGDDVRDFFDATVDSVLEHEDLIRDIEI